jgi:hypothetical protein
MSVQRWDKPQRFRLFLNYLDVSNVKLNPPKFLHHVWRLACKGRLVLKDLKVGRE